MKLYLGDNIRRKRIERDMTQSELAAMLGVSAQTVSRWEQCQVYPDIEFLPTLSRIFSCTIDELVGREDVYRDRLYSASHEARVKADEEPTRENFLAAFALGEQLYRLSGDTGDLLELWRLCKKMKSFGFSDEDPEREDKIRRRFKDELPKIDSPLWRSYYIGAFFHLEDDDHLEFWRDLAAPKHAQTFDDLMIARARTRNQKDYQVLVEERAYEQFLTFVSMVETGAFVPAGMQCGLFPCELLRALRDFAFSLGDEKRFLIPMMQTEGMLVRGYFEAGRKEEAYALLPELRRFIERAKEIVRAGGRNSDEIVEGLSPKTSYRSLDGRVMTALGIHLANTDDERVRELHESVGSDFIEQKKSAEELERAERIKKEFAVLLDAGRAEFDKRAISDPDRYALRDRIPQITVLESERGNIYTFYEKNCFSGSPEKDKLFAALKKSGDTKIRRAVVMIAREGFDVPSAMLRGDLLSLDSKNNETEFFTGRRTMTIKQMR